MSNKESLKSLYERLSPANREVLQQAVRLAEERRTPVFLVGGSVRDLLLDRPHVDLDLAVEGDAIDLAKTLAETLGARLVVHEAFGTASVTGGAFNLDLARTRAETYAHPGALPAVTPAPLDADLARRDFTINAMALRLTRPRPGGLIDPFHGSDDLSRRLVRVLHERSFKDDATRMLRAVRYEKRLLFLLEEETERSLRRDLPYLDTISGARIREELLAIFYEERVEEALRRSEALGLLATVHPLLRCDERTAGALGRAREERVAPWDEFCFCLLAWRGDLSETQALGERLALSRRHQRALKDSVMLRSLMDVLSGELRPSEVVEMLEGLSRAALWALALREPETPAGEKALHFLREWRLVRPFLGGRALKRMGIPEGPQLGVVLRRLRAARLDGLTATREDEIALVEETRHEG